MAKRLASLATGLALAATVAGTIAAPADAQRYRGGYHHGGGGAGVAVAAGILGLGVGAAIASSNRGYGYAPNYGYAPGYYAPPPPPYAYRSYCHRDWAWDGYRGRYVRVRYCD